VDGFQIKKGGGDVNRLTKTHSINMDLVISWLRSETATLNNVLDTIQRNDSYDDEYVKGAIKEVEIALRQIGRFIHSN
jgi:hypothetical protein